LAAFKWQQFCPSGIDERFLMATQEKQEKALFDRLASLPSAASRIKFLSRRRMLSPSTVKRLDAAVSIQVRVDLHKARELAEAAISVANELGDKESQAYALRSKGNALWFLGQNRSAAELHGQAIDLFQETGKAIEAGRTLSSAIQPLILLGEYDRARSAAERARKIFLAAGDTLRLARLDINVGNLFHRQDRFQEALECYERAHKQLLPDKDVEGIIAALHNIAVCRIMLNDYAKALSAYEQMREFCQGRNMPLPLAQADYNIAYLYYLRGNYGRSLAMLRTARETSQRAGDAYHAALCHLDLSEIYLELNLNLDAEELAQKAFNSFQELGLGYEAAKALCFSAIALSQQHKGLQALAVFAQARAMFAKEKNRVWPALIDVYQGWAYFNEGSLIEARRHCLAALDFFRNSVLPGRAILCRLLLARLSLKTGEIAAARQECQAVFRDLAEQDTPILTYQAHLVMGQVEEADRELEEARNHYRAAKEALEILRSGLRSEELKISFLENKLEVYENLVDLCLTRATPGARKEAWTYMEQAKSRALLESMARRAQWAGSDETQESALTLRMFDLREQLNWYYHRIEVEQLAQAPASQQRLLELWRLAAQQEKKFLRLFRELSPEAAQNAGLAPPEPLSLDTIRTTLGSNATIVEYFRVRDRILAALVSHDGLEIVHVTRASQIAAMLRTLQFQLSKFRLGHSYVDQFHASLLETTQARLRELYLELFAPIQHKIKGRELVIVPHELLHYVPFHALFDGDRYLIDCFTFSYAPSASIFAQCRRKRANKTGPCLLMGVPDAQTPRIYEELQSLARILPNAEVFLGRNACERVLREKGPQSRLIHIATHGFFRPDAPMLSGIRLGDTFMTLTDLYQLRLDADQVTLSGCSTGLNVIAPGDEMIGLMRGLLFAGARSLLLTWWDVSDGSTAEFMKAFYGRCFNHMDAASALQGAMQELRERHPHPYYWAPFALVGNVTHSHEPGIQGLQHSK
jgi:CHAT domain-containing protein